MDLYLVSLAAGATGLAAMAVSGVSHGGLGGRGAHHGGPATHATHAGHVPHAGHTAHAAHGPHPADHGSPGSWLQAFLSPRVLFALLVGFGAGGLLAGPLGEPWRLGAAIVAAAGFESLVVGPLWRLLFRFESQPALTLESAVEDDARAVTGFDASGCGLVAVEVDGQIIQLLATLSADDRARGTRVRSGDVLRVADIDAARGRCIVRTIDR
jgi:hypothetical protein